MDKIEEIRERARKATKGEWVVEVHKADGWEGHYGVKSLSGITIVPADCSWDGFGHGATQNDADFIAHSNSDIEYLLSELDRLNAEPSKRSVCKLCPIPEGITDEQITHAIYLLEAEGEGLIVRLPCKVGTKLYTIESKESEECDQDRIVPWIVWKIEYIDSDNTTDGQNQITIYYERTDDIFYEDRSCELDDFGKTVFLTSEEAAAKLEGK